MDAPDMDAPDKHIDQHRNMIEAARSAGVRKLVYTSVQGAAAGSAFSPIVQSNRQTEADVKASGLDWVIGRIGIYIDTYKARGEIANGAGDGLCAYTTRSELAYACAHMLTGSKHNGHTYLLHGAPITQAILARHLGDTFGMAPWYREMTVEAFRAERIAELVEFMGNVIAGIYQGIRDGAYDEHSDFDAAAGRPHPSWANDFGTLKNLPIDR
ncbi:hypothetical protein LPB72_02980 [Hydrogenophaga crassostreae]|uniref:NAD(P)-binding domain-containing protein n=2 Tax=Hydrogenophaga crassostreae TaxID=1763535 RepID=A0A167ISA3_9BURK|nr:hypothetical protein LPB072_18055 [Hydrogenophaga crassostreae]OAD43524.1 hypothetical protein LPB72_02980 [Hydrogenophaga crassostreae]